MHGGVHALRTNARLCPAVTRMLAMYAKQWVRDHPFTSLILFVDVQAPLHSDRNNAAGVNNFLIGLTEFTQGELWIESSSGSQACPNPAYQGCGVLLPVSRTCAFFDAHARHATCPWTGSRVVLAGFTVKGYNAFDDALHETLTGLGFQIPQMATGDFICHTLKPPPQPTFKSGLVPTCPVVFEIFSGTGRVTACLRKLGVSAAHAVDHCVHDEAAALPLLADLTTPEGRELCRFWLSSPLLIAVFAAPPCGTSSRAREIPCYDSCGSLLASPQPLRSQQHPDGLPTLAAPTAYELTKPIPCIISSAMLLKIATADMSCVPLRILNAVGTGQLRLSLASNTFVHMLSALITARLAAPGPKEPPSLARCRASSPWPKIAPARLVLLTTRLGA